MHVLPRIVSPSMRSSNILKIRRIEKKVGLDFFSDMALYYIKKAIV